MYELLLSKSARRKLTKLSFKNWKNKKIPKEAYLRMTIEKKQEGMTYVIDLLLSDADRKRLKKRL